jgi:WD repeat-containing protein 23
MSGIAALNDLERLHPTVADSGTTPSQPARTSEDGGPRVLGLAQLLQIIGRGNNIRTGTTSGTTSARVVQDDEEEEEDDDDGYVGWGFRQRPRATKIWVPPADKPQEAGVALLKSGDFGRLGARGHEQYPHRSHRNVSRYLVNRFHRRRFQSNREDIASVSLLKETA